MQGMPAVEVAFVFQDGKGCVESIEHQGTAWKVRNLEQYERFLAIPTALMVPFEANVTIDRNAIT